MLIVAGHLIVAADQREDYLRGCIAVVRQARSTEGCLDFAVSADLTEPERINVFERWESQDAVERFRGSGPTDEQSAQIRSAAMAEYVIDETRQLS